MTGLELPWNTRYLCLYYVLEATSRPLLEVTSWRSKQYQPSGGRSPPLVNCMGKVRNVKRCSPWTSSTLWPPRRIPRVFTSYNTHIHNKVKEIKEFLYKHEAETGGAAGTSSVRESLSAVWSNKSGRQDAYSRAMPREGGRML